MIRRKPLKSLRTILIWWFLIFSLVPLTFITGYSLRTYDAAINNEVKQRLRGNARELGIVIVDYEKLLQATSRTHLTNPSLAYYLSTNNFQAARRLAFQWMSNRSSDRISLFNRRGCFLASVFVGENGEPQSMPNVEAGNICANEEFLSQIKGKEQILLTEAVSAKSLDLIVFTKIRGRKNEVVGYLEQVVRLNGQLLGKLKKRMGLELAVLDQKGLIVSSSHPDLVLSEKNIFQADVKDGKEADREMFLRNTPFAFYFKPVQWGDHSFHIALGVSKSPANLILQDISVALLIVGMVVIILLVILSFISSRLILKPLSTLVEATTEMDQREQALEIPVQGQNEISVLTESFNEMSRRITQARADLRGKIHELEGAYSELKETQARLVHTAKMASLGQLVAGVAHELNNPIGFIYSNMGHLKDYSEKLMHLIQVAETRPSDLARAKKECEYDYITEDLPRLIQSCEEGAKRTRDIVLGLRNFSRLEEAKVKTVDLRVGIQNTLNLLAGDLKGRIKVTTDFLEVPEIRCYPSQLNQVFMNILANAAQAIDGPGEISIKIAPVTQAGRNDVQVIIRDSGKGMAPETIEKIFDPFFTTKSVGQGTGLGLSISYGIVKKHNGEIQVSSKLGEGTEFIITLPVDGVEEGVA